MNLQTSSLISSVNDFPSAEKQQSGKMLKRTFIHSISDIESYIEHDQISKKVSKKLHMTRQILTKSVKSSYKSSQLDDSNHELNEMISLFINDMKLPEDCPSIPLNYSSFNATFLDEFLSNTKGNPLCFWDNVFMMEQEVFIR